MNPEHAELYSRIEAFPLDAPDSELPFSERLAKENGWSPAYARRVVAEYKKFAFLAVVAGHPVSPSDPVDQAWHAHLTYTQSYWGRFCPEVLGKPLHHNPSKGGQAEGEKFRDWYEKTLASYRRVIGQAPPDDIWPDGKTRSRSEPQFRRVDTRRNWVVPKPQFRLPARRVLLQFLTVVVLSISAAGCVPLLTAVINPFELKGPDFLALYIVSLIVAVIIAIVLRRFLLVPNDEPDTEAVDLDPYEIALLARNERLTINAAIASLVQQGSLEVRVNREGGILGIGSSTNYRVAASGPLPAGAHALERAVYDAAEVSSGLSIEALQSAGSSAIGAIRRRLEYLGLLMSDSDAAKTRFWPSLVMAAAVLFGVIKIWVGLERNKPVMFLVFITVVAIAASIPFFKRPYRSLRGERALEYLKAKNTSLESALKQGSPTLSSADVALGMGLFGMGVLSGGGMNDLHAALTADLKKGGGGGGCGAATCGGGGGCGGGGCGGGGCGGCGGGCGGG